MSTTKVTGMMQTSTKGGDISSASPTVIDTDGDYFDVTGTTNFAAFTVVAGRRFTVQFDGVLTMTHHATTLDLPGAANITTAAGDVAEFFATGTNTVQCVSYTKADGTAVVAPSGVTLGTAQATTSAGSKTFSGIPSGTKNIIISFNEVSTAVAASIDLRLGDSGGIEASGYVSTGTLVTGTDIFHSNSTAGFMIRIEDTGFVFSGQMVLTLLDASAFTWISSHFGKTSTTAVIGGGGSKSLSAELTQLYIVLDDNSYDAGSINIMYW
jgi:hypothetical protein